MNVFGLGASSPSVCADLEDILHGYKRLRPLRMRLNHELVSQLSKSALIEGAKKLGMLHGDTFVFDSEDETSVLMDYCIHHVSRNGRYAVEQYLGDCAAEPDSDEMVYLRTLQHSTYTMLIVLRVEPGVGCYVRNLFTDETRLLVDIGLSQTAKPNGIIATRLLDHGDHVTTGGAALVLGVLDDEHLNDWQRQLRGDIDTENFDPAPLIREFLRAGAGANIRYDEPDGQRRTEKPAKRKRTLATRQARQTAQNRRCRCGSGKMYKNCCGKH